MALIGVDSDSYECNLGSDMKKRNIDQPAITWHKTDRKIEKTKCIWPPIIDRDVDGLIKDVINNKSIFSLNEKSRLVCVAIGRQASPILKWRSIDFPSKKLQSKTIFDPPAPTSLVDCQKNFKTISILEIDHFLKSYECSLDQEASCSVRRQCRYKLLVDRRINTVYGTFKNESESRLKCEPLLNGPCSKYLSDEPRLGFSSSGVTGVVKKLSTLGEREIDVERLCYFLYPVCENGTEPINFLPLCREQCYILQFRYTNLWPILTRYIANFFSRQKWTGCDQLPSISTNRSRCRQIARNELDRQKFNTQCYDTDDRHYVGTVNRTAGGFICQRWDSVCPQDHDDWPLMYPELRGAENYCRNPGGRKKMPWCYTIHSGARFAYCTGIPRCSADQPTAEPIKSTSDRLITVSICTGLLFFISAIVIYVVKRNLIKFRRRSIAEVDTVRYRDSETVEIEWRTEASAFLDLPSNELYFRNESGLDRRLEPLEVPRSSWCPIRALAHTEFNDVFLARFQTNSIDFVQLTKRPTLVVKSLKNPCPQGRFDNFVREACIVADCSHDRIVRLLGVCFVTEPASILFEHVSLGDLKSILESEISPGNDEELSARIETFRKNWNPPLRSPKRQIDFCYQILDGMVYLSNRGIVHRDLAARNVLVDEKLLIKISDFGLSKQVDRVGGVFVADESECLPVRWTAPEAWSRRQFSSKSDVWSFGVVVWEILSFGMQPYSGLSHQEVVNLVVVERKALSIPKMFNDLRENEKIGRALMKPCFAYNPENRPLFIELFSNAAKLKTNFDL